MKKPSKPELVSTTLPLADLVRLIREEVRRQLIEQKAASGPEPFTNSIHTKMRSKA